MKDEVPLILNLLLRTGNIEQNICGTPHKNLPHLLVHANTTTAEISYTKALRFEPVQSVVAYSEHHYAKHL